MSGLTIFLACLGILGLAAFTAEQRSKEIGIRKVFGAGIFQIVCALSVEFARLVGIAALIALPAAGYMMQGWLEGFAYRTELSWPVFVLAGGITLLLALLAVISQTFRAASRNPVDSLRCE